jgi:hypothetical protein
MIYMRLMKVAGHKRPCFLLIDKSLIRQDGNQNADFRESSRPFGEMARIQVIENDHPRSISTDDSPERFEGLQVTCYAQATEVMRNERRNVQVTPPVVDKNYDRLGGLLRQGRVLSFHSARSRLIRAAAPRPPDMC